MLSTKTHFTEINFENNMSEDKTWSFSKKLNCHSHDFADKSHLCLSVRQKVELMGDVFPPVAAGVFSPRTAAQRRRR